MSSTNVHDDLLPFLQKNYVLIRKGRLWSFLGGVAAFLVAAGVVSYQAAVSAIKSSSATAALADIEATQKAAHDLESQLAQMVDAYKSGGITKVISVDGPPKAGTVTTYRSRSGRFALLGFGSGLSNAANAKIGMDLQVNGKTVAHAAVFANPAQVHTAFVPAVFVNHGDPGEYNISLQRLEGPTYVDNNDHFEVLAIELP